MACRSAVHPDAHQPVSRLKETNDQINSPFNAEITAVSLPIQFVSKELIINEKYFFGGRAFAAHHFHPSSQFSQFGDQQNRHSDVLQTTRTHNNVRQTMPARATDKKYDFLDYL